MAHGAGRADRVRTRSELASNRTGTFVPLVLILAIDSVYSGQGGALRRHAGVSTGRGGFDGTVPLLRKGNHHRRRLPLRPWSGFSRRLLCPAPVTTSDRKST